MNRPHTLGSSPLPNLPPSVEGEVTQEDSQCLSGSCVVSPPGAGPVSSSPRGFGARLFYICLLPAMGQALCLELPRYYLNHRHPLGQEGFAHFLEEKTEAQRGEVTCPCRSLSIS